MEERSGRFDGAYWIGGLLLSWFFAGFGVLSWLGAAMPFFMALHIWKSSRSWAIFLGLASPVVVAAGLAVTSYFRGTASLGFHGLPGLSSYNLDRETRLPRQGGGCVVNGSEWLWDAWPNSILRGCVAVFGPMKGTPDGEYPSEVVLTEPWPDAEWLQIRDLRSGRVSLGGEIRTIPCGADLLDRYASWAEDEQASPPDSLWDPEEAVELRGKAFVGGSFAVRIESRMFGDEPASVTILFGGNPAVVMGYFAPRGSAQRSRFPPILPGR